MRIANPTFVAHVMEQRFLAMMKWMPSSSLGRDVVSLSIGPGILEVEAKTS
jgi:hypothetical protein